jgi:hypothetical protein
VKNLTSRCEIACQADVTGVKCRTMKPYLAFTAVFSALLGTMFAQSGDAGKPEWHHVTEENPLSGKTFDRFMLTGKYFTPPATATIAPQLLVSCEKGKFRSGEFNLGAVAKFSGMHSLKGIEQAQVDMRIDEKKKTQDWFEISNDRRTLFFDKVQLTRFLTGSLFGHPTHADSLAHHLVLGVVEELGNQVIAQFDMPEKDSEMLNACGLVKW